MNQPPSKVCEKICALHISLTTSNAQLDTLLKVLEANKLKASDLPEFFYRLGASSAKPLPPENICNRIYKLHAQITASKQEWSTARKKLLCLLDKETLSWAIDLPAILAAVWFKENRQNTSASAAAAASATTPSVDVFELNKVVTEDRVVMSNAECIVAALWNLLTYKYRTFEFVPHIGYISPASGCGKSTALKTHKAVVANPWYSSHVTAPGVYRKLRRQSHTCLLDEGENQGLLEDRKLRALIDAAFERDGCFDLVEDGETISIPVFAPFAWAIRGELRDVPLAVLSRSFIIYLKKRTPRKRYSNNDLMDTHQANLGWAANVQLDLDPAIPEELSRDPRVADLCRPLLAIADQLNHGAEARAALIEVCADRPNQDVGVQMLLDTRAVWHALEVDRLSKKDLAKAVIELAPERWDDWRGPNDRGQPHTLTLGELSRLLARFKICAHTVWPVPRLPTSRSFVGYYRSDFERAWHDYCSEDHMPAHSGKVIKLAKPAKPTSEAE